jgi:hypothetical protein
MIRKRLTPRLCLEISDFAFLLEGEYVLKPNEALFDIEALFFGGEGK